MQAGNKDFDLELKITDKDAFVTNDLYVGAIFDFQRSSDVLFEYVYSWAYTKEYPEKAAEQIQKHVELKKQQRG